MRKLLLVVERSRDGKFWGRTKFENNILVDFAVSLEALEKKMKKGLQNFHKIEPSKIKFQLAFDLTALFTQMNYLNVSAVALKAGISQAIMRQYVAGLKYPSLKRAKLIETAINNLGQEMIATKVVIAKNAFSTSAG